MSVLAPLKHLIHAFFTYILNKNKENIFEVIKNDEPIIYFNFEKNNKNTAQRHNS